MTPVALGLRNSAEAGELGIIPKLFGPQESVKAKNPLGWLFDLPSLKSK